MNALSIEKAVAASPDVMAMYSVFLPAKLAVEVTITTTYGPVELTSLFVAATNIFAVEVLHYGRCLDVAIEFSLKLTLVYIETGFVHDIPYVSYASIAPNPLILSRH